MCHCQSTCMRIFALDLICQYNNRPWIGASSIEERYRKARTCPTESAPVQPFMARQSLIPSQE